MAEQLDLGKLAELQQLLGSELAQIVDTLVEELSGALRSIGSALAAGDLGAAALAAHAARNSALMIDSRSLLGELDRLEASARDGDGQRARQVHHRLQELWPPLRGQLERAVTSRG